ncbi:MAG: hypothetical protein KF729_24750 [Sandaracinaceae bacterium]|nr:hypothetical protein [Sandaracinaceae bacterium]
MSRATLALLCGCSLMGCILTRNPTYESPENTPAVVLEDPDFRMGTFHRVNLSGDSPADGGVEMQLEVRAIVRDPDLEQPLVGLVFQDYDLDASENRTITNDIAIPPSARDTRDVRFFIDYSELRRGCRVIELHVSEAFVNTRNPTPRRSGDLGRGFWFVRVFENADDEISLEECVTPGRTP